MTAPGERSAQMCLERMPGEVVDEDPHQFSGREEDSAVGRSSSGGAFAFSPLIPLRLTRGLETLAAPIFGRLSSYGAATEREPTPFKTAPSMGALASLSSSMAALMCDALVRPERATSTTPSTAERADAVGDGGAEGHR